MLLQCTRFSTAQPMVQVAPAGQVPRLLAFSRSHARNCAVEMRSTLCAPPLSQAALSRWSALVCRVNDGADPKSAEEDIPSPRQKEARGAVSPAADPTLDAYAALKDVNPLVLLGGSWALYGILIGASVAFSGSTGPGIWEQLSAPWPPAAALLYLSPLLAALVVFETQAERYPAVGQIRQMLRLTLLPSLRRLSWWERSLLALSAGLGEEVFFRGFLQASAAERLLEVVSWSEPAAVAATSLVFGALHAVTPLYFIIATLAGGLFGAEYLQAGLGAAVVTHWVYDWIAFEVALITAGADSATNES